MRDTDHYDIDDYRPCQASGSAEPFVKPDYRAKKHPKPRNVDCRGRFALRRRPKMGRLLVELEAAE